MKNILDYLLASREETFYSTNKSKESGKNKEKPHDPKVSEDALRKSSFQPVSHFWNYSSLIQPVAEIAFNELKCHFGHRKYFQRVSHVAQRDEHGNSFVHQSLQFLRPLRETFQAIITNDDYTTFELWIHKKEVESSVRGEKVAINHRNARSFIGEVEWKKYIQLDNYWVHLVMTWLWPKSFDFVVLMHDCIMSLYHFYISSCAVCFHMKKEIDYDQGDIWLTL